MGTVDRLIREQRDLKNRARNIIAQFGALPLAVRHSVFVELTEIIERDLRGTRDTGTEAHVARTRSGETYTARAETYVLENGRGVTTTEVAEVIGQRSQNAHQSLTNASRSNRRIERRGKLWFPVEKGSEDDGVTRLARVTDTRTNREIVQQVLTDAARPLRLLEIADMVVAVDPTRKSPSVVAELHRIKEAGLIAPTNGAGGRGAAYLPANGGEPV